MTNTSEDQDLKKILSLCLTFSA